MLNKALKSNAGLIENGKITARQLGFIAVTLVIATADVLLPALVALEAKQDAWISVIIATLVSLVVVTMIVTLGLRYPGST